MRTSKFKILVNLSRQLLPTGRAFRMFKDSETESLFRALSRTEADAYDAAVSIKDSMFPDNDQFTTDDATDWERRLGMVSNPLTPLADRMAAIKRKMASPGRNPARGHYLWIQKQLQDAGFDVYVHENIPEQFPTPTSFYITGSPQFGDFQFGFLFGGRMNNLVVSSTINTVDQYFYPGVNGRAMFFIGGSALGSFADVPAAREKEFRNLILNLKQVQNIAGLFINYV